MRHKKGSRSEAFFGLLFLSIRGGKKLMMMMEKEEGDVI